MARLTPQPDPPLTIVDVHDPAVEMAATILRLSLTSPETQAAAAFPSLGRGERRWSVIAMIGSEEDLGHEGFLVRPHPGSGQIVVTGGGPLGLAFGLQALANDLRLNRRYLEYPVPLVRRPATQLRLVSDPLEPEYPPLETAIALGFNAVMTEPWPALALYEGLDLYGPAERIWVLERREAARARIAAAKALHLRVFAPGDLVLLPQGVGDRLCIDDGRIRSLVARGLEEVFGEFPDLDGIVVRTGESYSLGPLWGAIPASCGPEGVREAVAFMHQEVVQRHGRQLIVRAWDLGDEGNHARPQRFREIYRDGVVFSFKVTQTDFWRYNEVNPNLVRTPVPSENLKERTTKAVLPESLGERLSGLVSPGAQPRAPEGPEGRGVRMIEFQAAREFEGKGAFPNYVAPIYVDGLRLAAPSHGWVWAKGGGWGGPHPAATLWLDANVYALARLLWDPQAEPRQLAEEWSALRFGPAAAPHLTALLMRSTEAVLKGFYVGCYSETHPGWAPNLLWVRDDLIGGGAQLQMMYQYCDSRLGFHEALWEKGEAVAIVDQMIADLALAQPHVVDQGVIRWMEASLRYQRSLFESLRLYLTGMFWHYRGNQPLAVESFRQLEESWATHQGSAEAATPFQDAGMWAAVESALRAPSDGKTLGP